MKKLLLVLSLALVCAGGLRAAVVDFSFHAESVTLKDGRQLRDVDFENYNPDDGRVGLLRNGEFTTVALRDLPDDIARRITALATVTEPTAAESPPAAPERETEIRVREPEPGRAVRREWTDTRTEIVMEDEAAIRDLVAAAARERAAFHFRSEVDPYATVGHVAENNIALERPERVPGWSHRWRVRGIVDSQYQTRSTGALGRPSREFEVLIEAPPDSPPLLVGVTLVP